MAGLQGFTDRALIILPSMYTWEHECDRYQYQVQEAVQNIRKIFKRWGIATYFTFSDEVALGLYEWDTSAVFLKTITDEDLSFLCRSNEMEVQHIHFEEIPGLPEQLRKEYPADPLGTKQKEYEKAKAAYEAAKAEAIANGTPLPKRKLPKRPLDRAELFNARDKRASEIATEYCGIVISFERKGSYHSGLNEKSVIRSGIQSFTRKDGTLAERTVPDCRVVIRAGEDNLAVEGCWMDGNPMNITYIFPDCAWASLPLDRWGTEGI